MSPFPLLLLCIVVCFLIITTPASYNRPTEAESLKQVNDIVAEAKASPDGKPLLDYIITLQKDGLSIYEAEKIAEKYDEWKLFYSFKDIIAEAKASPNGKPLLDYITTLQKDGLTISESKDIVVKYEDWKLFYSLKDVEPE